MDKECLERIKHKIDYDAWCGRSTLSESLFIYKYFISASDFEDWQLHRQRPIDVDGLPHCIQSMWRDPNGDQEALLRVDIYECDSHTDAHEFLVHFVSQFQTTEVYRRDDVGIGDVVFVPDSEQAVLFIRANLLVFLADAGRTRGPLIKLAHDFDDALVDRPDRSALAATSQALRISVLDSTLPEGGVTPVKLQIEERGDHAFYYRIFCSSGEMLIKQGQLSFQASVEGSPTIDVYATGEGGSVAYQQLSITVMA